MDEEYAPKPKALDKMIELSRILSKGFKHVRVDWFDYPESEEGILFGEMSFSHCSGLSHFEPQKYDLIFGEMI